MALFTMGVTFKINVMVGVSCLTQKDRKKQKEIGSMIDHMDILFITITLIIRDKRLIIQIWTTIIGFVLTVIRMMG
jgi:hypothetical protein